MQSPTPSTYNDTCRTTCRAGRASACTSARKPAPSAAPSAGARSRPRPRPRRTSLPKKRESPDGEEAEEAAACSASSADEVELGDQAVKDARLAMRRRPRPGRDRTRRMADMALPWVGVREQAEGSSSSPRSSLAAVLSVSVLRSAGLLMVVMLLKQGLTGAWSGSGAQMTGSGKMPVWARVGKAETTKMNMLVVKPVSELRRTGSSLGHESGGSRGFFEAYRQYLEFDEKSMQWPAQLRKAYHERRLEFWEWRSVVCLLGESW